MIKQKNIHNNTKIISLMGFGLNQLHSFCVDIGITKYRGTQLYEWMYRQGECKPQNMNNLSKSFRNYLEEHCTFSTLITETIILSNIDSTKKILFRTNDNKFIESVSIIDQNRHTVCISSQIGCNLDCNFCATGAMGFIRNLTTGEIIEQIILVRSNTTQPITNVVFMGMGEPFLNYDNVISAADILHNPLGFNLGSLRITISTSGILPKIKRYIKEKRKYKLAISLNASNNVTRNKIMPMHNKWTIEELVKIGEMFAHNKRQNIMFEYVLIDGINDSDEDALILANLLKNIRCKINIIPFNEVQGNYKRPIQERINSFINILQTKRSIYRVLVRWSKGKDIAAACGQLATEKI